MFKRLLSILLFLCLATPLLFGQVNNRMLKKAEALENSLSYAAAIETYTEYLNKEKSLEIDHQDRIKLKLANLYYLVKDFSNAEKYFNEGLINAPLLKGDDLKYYLKYAQVLSSNGKHQQSSAIWKKYSSLNEQDKVAENFIKSFFGTLKKFITVKTTFYRFTV